MQTAEESRYGLQLLVGAAVLTAGLSLVATETWAQPIRARRMVVSVATAYEPCTAPDATADSTGVSACTAPLSADPVCRLGVRGRGKVQLRGIADDVKVLARLDGIDPACDGETLEFRMSFRVTSNDCSGQTCTLVDFVDQLVGSCDVSAGVCRLSTTLNGAVPDMVIPTQQTHIDFLGCDFKRTTGPSLPNRTFSCALMIP